MVEVPDRVLGLSNGTGLLNGQLPALTLRAVGAVVCTAAGHKELWLCGDAHVGLMCATGHVLKLVGVFSIKQIHTLRKRCVHESVSEQATTSWLVLASFN